MASWLEAKESEFQNRGTWLCVSALVFALTGTLFIPVMISVSFISAAASVLLFISGLVVLERAEILKTGIEGELRLEERLREILPEGALIERNIPAAWGDIDCLVLTEERILLFEVKNHRGEIVIDGERWYQKKTGRAGTPYQVGLKCPAKSIYANIMYLKKKGTAGWIEPAVVFTNPEVKLTVKKEPDGIRVMRIDDVDGFLSEKLMKKSITKSEE